MAKGEADIKEVEELVAKVETLLAEVSENRKDAAAILAATQELTKVISDLNAAWEKWRKAGKF